MLKYSSPGRLGDLLPLHKLQELPHPWLVVEDCHVSVRETMMYLAQQMEVGDYIVIEDTSPYTYSIGWRILSDGEMRYCTEAPVEDHHAKHNIVVQFLKTHEDFKVDSYYADYFAFNATNTWDGYIKKVIDCPKLELRPKL